MENAHVDQMLNGGNPETAQTWSDILDVPITEEELQTGVHRGTGNKAPRNDGTGMEFFNKKTGI